MHGEGSTGAAGLRAGFQAEYETLGPALYAWARLRIPPPLRTRLDPEDLAQEVCVRALDGLARFDPERGSLRMWLFGIANVVLRDLGRQLARLPTTSANRFPSSAGESAGLLGSIPVEMTTVVSRAARNERLVRFVEEIEHLDEEDRQLVIYRGLEGLELAEVGALMGLGRDAAAKRWQRLRVRLEAGPLPGLLSGGD